MAGSELILDYASRRKRSAFRLASASLLEATWSDDGERFVVHEWLAEQHQALAAVVGTLVMLAIAACNSVGLWFGRIRPMDFVVTYVPIVSGLLLIPAVIHPPLLPGRLRDRAEPWRAEASRTVGWAIGAAVVARTAKAMYLPHRRPSFVHLPRCFDETCAMSESSDECA